MVRGSEILQEAKTWKGNKQLKEIFFKESYYSKQNGGWM